MSGLLESALNAAQLTRRVWVERRATGRQAVVYWLSQVAYPPGFLGFNVYRSPQPTDDMTSPSLVLLTPEPVAVPFFLDTIDPHAIPSYVVTAVDGSGEEPIDRPVQVGDTSDPDHQGRRFPILSMPRIFAEFRRRKNILLGLNGELVTVLVRRLYGRRCKKCFVGPYETAGKSDCDSCFPPGTLVRTETGYRPIEQIEVGDRVLSSDGKFHAVLATMKRRFSGNLMSILPSTSTVPILATPEHPFLVMGGTHDVKVGCSSSCERYLEDRVLHAGSVRLLPSGNWWARAQIGGSKGEGRTALGTHPTKMAAQAVVSAYLESKKTLRHELIWLPAKDVTSDSWTTAKWPHEVVDVESVSPPPEVTRKRAHGSQRNGPTSFRVDMEFLWMVGLYLAEGSANPRTITFALHAEEVAFQQRLKRYFQPLGYTATIKNKKGTLGCTVSVHSTTLAVWFREWLGSKCYNKRIPEELMRLPNYKSQSILQGIDDGDGWKNGHQITQTSQVLALQIVELLHRLGEQPLVRRQVAKALTPKGNKRRVAYETNWALDTLTHNNRQGRWKFGDEQLSRVRSVDSVPYDGQVYNLEVEGTNDYVVEGVVVHNCFGTAYERGYEIVPSVQCRISSIKEALQLQPPAIMFKSNPTGWLVGFPLLRNGDVIVRPLEGKRYEVQTLSLTVHQGILTGQDFDLIAFEPYHPIFNFPVV